MTKAKLLSMLLGWWGIPWGPIYTLGVLFESGEGKIPAEPNAEYLRELGLYLLDRGNLTEARLAWEASLELVENPELRSALQSIPQPTTEPSPKPHPAAEPAMSPVEAKPAPKPKKTKWLWIGISIGILLLAAIIVLVGVAVLAPSPSSPTPSVPASIAPPQPPPGYTIYSSTELGLAFYIPDGWQFEKYERGEITDLVFDSGGVGEELILARVSLAKGTGVRESAFEEADLIDLAQKIVAHGNQKLVDKPKTRLVDSHRAVSFAYQGTTPDILHELHAFALVAALDDQLLFVEVSSLPESKSKARDVFDMLIASMKIRQP